WLVARQRDDGTFDVAGPRPVADHCLVTYALVEAFGLSRWRGPASASAGRALTAMLRMRHRDGGWAVAPDEVGVDGVSTAWGVLACRSAREFAIEPETPSAAELRRWLDGVATDTTRAAAAVLVARQRLDEGDGDATAAATADHLLERTDPAHPEATFWTTYALYRIGGERGRRWSLALRGALLRSQQADGEQRGSWSPAPGSSRVVTTALNTLTLEAYFRYSRLVR
ncbi:MAG: hypothetical protein KAI24_00440, partial [Planctomycetes bacterium]|nr:hypothetical protein [Planctomycetota bacterium]